MRLAAASAAFALAVLADPRAAAQSFADGDWPTLSGAAPEVIAHRGASGYRPEHTRAAFLLAIEQGADVIEPDLQMTADGVLVVRHDPYLSTTTDIAERPDFADRTAERGGKLDWWVMDFTAAELARLRARQPFPERRGAFDDEDPILTFEAFLDLIAAEEAACGCVIPIEPEVKQPAEYAAAGLDPLPPLLEILRARGLDAADAPIVVQSFDPAFLQRLDAESEVRLAMLTSGEPGYDAGGLSLEEIAGFADAVGPWKGLLIDESGASTGFVEAAHDLGLVVHAWTVRADRAPHVGESVEDELRALYALGVDGVFTDHPDVAVAVREAMRD